MAARGASKCRSFQQVLLPGAMPGFGVPSRGGFGQRWLAFQGLMHHSHIFPGEMSVQILCSFLIWVVFLILFLRAFIFYVF